MIYIIYILFLNFTREPSDPCSPRLQDFQLWCDLREFELRLGVRYLTHRGDEERWARHAREKGLDFPSHLGRDPDDDDPEV